MSAFDPKRTLVGDLARTIITAAVSGRVKDTLMGPAGGFSEWD